MDCVDIDLAACLQQTVARSSFEPDTESNEHQPDIFTVRLIAVYLDSPCHKDKNNGYRLELHPLTSSLLRGCRVPPRSLMMLLIYNQLNGQKKSSVAQQGC